MLIHTKRQVPWLYLPFFFRKDILGFSVGNGEELTIDTGNNDETGWNSKGKITAGALGLRSTGIKAEG